MKSTGMVRKVDELGRIVVPIELRRTLGIEVKDPLEIYVDEDKIIFKKYVPGMSCMITGEVSETNLSLAGGKIKLSEAAADQLLEELSRKVHQKNS